MTFGSDFEDSTSSDGGMAPWELERIEPDSGDIVSGRQNQPSTGAPVSQDDQLHPLARWRTWPHRKFAAECDRDFRLAVLNNTPREHSVVKRILSENAASDASFMSDTKAAAVGFALATSRAEDIAMTWLACAAANGSISASFSVVSALFYLREIEPNPQQARHFTKLARGWLHHTHSYARLHDGRRRDMLIRELKTLEPQLDDGATEDPNTTTSGQLAGPTKVVVPFITDTGKESADLIKTYRPLTKPLPLRGGNLKLRPIKEALNLKFPWMADVTERVIAELALGQMAGRGYASIRPLLLVGPPGVGKSAFLKYLSSLLGLGYDELNAAGSVDSRLLQGTARGWSTAQPGFALQVILRCKSANPIIYVDEIDKCGDSPKSGSIAEGLLPFLERETAKRITDDCLIASADLSDVSWVLSANNIDFIPAPLRSRLTIYDVSPPELEHFDGIFDEIVNSIARKLDCPRNQLPELEPETIEVLRANFARWRSIRPLARAVESAISASIGLAPPRLIH